MTSTHRPLMKLAAISALLLSSAVSRADTPSPPSGKVCIFEAMQSVQDGWSCFLSEEVLDARFEGFVMYETQDGALRPVTDVVFLQMGAKPDPPSRRSLALWASPNIAATISGVAPFHRILPSYM